MWDRERPSGGGWNSLFCTDSGPPRELSPAVSCVVISTSFDDMLDDNGRSVLLARASEPFPSLAYNHCDFDLTKLCL